MKNFSASRLELSLCCSRWEKFKCRCHCRLYLCEGWIKGKLICYIRITRNYLIKGSVLRPHPVKFWVPLSVIIAQALCVLILAFDVLHSENILPNSLIVTCFSASCVALRRVCLQPPPGTVFPRLSCLCDSPLDPLNANRLTGELKLVTVPQMWPHKCSGGEGSCS